MKYSNAPTGEEYEGFWDAAQVLTDEYNEFQKESGDYDLLDVEDIAEALKVYVSPQDLHKLINSQFTRGLLLGQLLYHLNIEIAAAEGEESGSDDELY